MENTIPVKYRDAVRQGALLWNKAFEKIGLQDAIVVNQQPDDADWDPADIRYNTIRWFAATDAGFAIGPSRANPLTGELYDADISFSDGIMRSVRGVDAGTDRAGELGTKRRRARRTRPDGCRTRGLVLHVDVGHGAAMRRSGSSC